MNVPCESEWQEYNITELQEDKSFIYFLYDEEDKIIYIGQTRDFLVRMGTHLKEKKEVKKIRYFLISSKNVDTIEKDLIIKHKPKYNYIKEIKEKPKCFSSLKEYLNFYKISVNKFSQKIFCNREYLRDILWGNVLPSKGMAILIAEATGGEVTIEDLMKGE